MQHYSFLNQSQLLRRQLAHMNGPAAVRGQGRAASCVTDGCESVRVPRRGPVDKRPFHPGHLGKKIRSVKRKQTNKRNDRKSQIAVTATTTTSLSIVRTHKGSS